MADTEQLTIKVEKSDCAKCRGSGDVHRPGDKRGSTITVRVLNELGLPQPEAGVTFAAQTEGPGVVFEDGKTLVTKQADAEGYASLPGVQGNKVRGQVTVTVTAEFEGKKGRLEIPQVNERGPVLNRKRGTILAGALATTGIILYEVFKPGPPTATINAPSASTSSPQLVIARPRVRIGR